VQNTSIFGNVAAQSVGTARVGTFDVSSARFFNRMAGLAAVTWEIEYHRTQTLEYRLKIYIGYVEGEKTGDGISYASHVKNPNPLKARATTFYDPVHNALDKETFYDSVVFAGRYTYLN
jgi:hypothetical protein